MYFKLRSVLSQLFHDQLQNATSSTQASRYLKFNAIHFSKCINHSKRLLPTTLEETHFNLWTGELSDTCGWNTKLLFSVADSDATGTAAWQRTFLFIVAPAVKFLTTRIRCPRSNGPCSLQLTWSWYCQFILFYFFFFKRACASTSKFTQISTQSSHSVDIV